MDFHHRQRIQMAVSAELVCHLLLNGRFPRPDHLFPDHLRLRPVLHLQQSVTQFRRDDRQYRLQQV